MGIKIDIKDPSTQKLMMFAALVICIIIVGYAISITNTGNNSTVGNNTTVKNNEIVKNGGVVVQNTNNANNVSNGQEMRFIVVGDPHVKSSSGNSDRGNARLAQVVNFIDTSNVDFAVFLGDIADDGKTKTYDIAKSILKNSTKPYYTVAGNHDVLTGSGNFEIAFGSMEHLENIKGYQLIFPGIYFEGASKLHWSFDFNKANKSLPTLVFMHGPTVLPPNGATSCNWGKDFFGYGQSMQPELNKFSSLVAEYSGHVHYHTDQTINGVRYVTVNGLVNKAGGCDNEGPSDYVGYSRIKDGKVDYMLIDYNNQFEDPFPDK
jgi:hypothetical protein